MPVGVHVCYNKNALKEFAQVSHEVLFKHKLQADFFFFFLKEQLDLDVSSLAASTRLDLELHYTEINRN